VSEEFGLRETLGSVERRATFACWAKKPNSPVGVVVKCRATKWKEVLLESELCPGDCGIWTRKK